MNIYFIYNTMKTEGKLLDMRSVIWQEHAKLSVEKCLVKIRTHQETGQ